MTQPQSMETVKTAATELKPYDPSRLLDALLRKMQWKNDTVLAQKLNVQIDVIRRIRAGTLPAGASMLLWLQEASGVSIDELRQLIGDRRAKLRISCTWTLKPTLFNRFMPPTHPSALLVPPMKRGEQNDLNISGQPGQ